MLLINRNEASRKAKECRTKAHAAGDPGIRDDWLELAKNWNALVLATGQRDHRYIPPEDSEDL